MNRKQQLDEIAAGEEDHSEPFDDPRINCKACDNDMTTESHKDGYQICGYCRDFALENEGQTVEQLMDYLNIER